MAIGRAVGEAGGIVLVGFADRIATHRNRLAQIDGDDLRIRREAAPVGAGIAILDCTEGRAADHRVFARARRKLSPRRQTHARDVDDGLVALARAKALRDLGYVAARSGAGEVL